MNEFAEATGTGRRIYTAATDLFYKYGYHGTTLRMLSEIVRVKTPSIYYHVGNKQDLLSTIMSRTLEGIIDEVRRQVEPVSDPRERLRAAVETHIRLHASLRKEVFVADSEVRALEESHRVKVIKLRDEYEDIYKKLVSDCLALPGSADRDVDLSTYSILSMCTGVAGWYQPGGRYSLDYIATEYGGLVLGSLGLLDDVQDAS